jgi:hypothetical protein
MKDKEEKYVPMGTKVSPWAADVWNEVCNSLHTDTYHLLQQFVQAMLRASSTWHNKSPEVERLLTALDLDVGWQKAINICAPGGKLTIEQLILIVSQEDKSGCEAVMIEKPFMGDAMQTINTNEIFERIVEVIWRKTYERLRKLAAQMGIQTQRELVERMLEDQLNINIEDSDREESQGINDYAENNRRLEYGKRTKRVKHRSPDEYIEQELDFDAMESKQREEKSEEARKWLEEHSNGERPYDMEW